MFFNSIELSTLIILQWKSKNALLSIVTSLLLSLIKFSALYILKPYASLLFLIFELALFGFVLGIGGFPKNNIYPITTYKDIKKNAQHTICAICIDDFEDKQIVIVTNCTHVFHKPCFDGWCKVKQVCPMCRNDVKNV